MYETLHFRMSYWYCKSGTCNIMYETVETCIQWHMGRGGVNGRSRLRCVEAKSNKWDQEGRAESYVIWHISRGSRTGPVDPTTTGPCFHKLKKIVKALLLVAHADLLHVCCGSLIVALNPFFVCSPNCTHPVQKVSAHATLIKWSLAL